MPIFDKDGNCYLRCSAPQSSIVNEMIKTNNTNAIVCYNKEEDVSKSILSNKKERKCEGCGVKDTMLILGKCEGCRSKERKCEKCGENVAWLDVHDLCYKCTEKDTVERRMASPGMTCKGCDILKPRHEFLGLDGTSERSMEKMSKADQDIYINYCISCVESGKYREEGMNEITKSEAEKIREATRRKEEAKKIEKEERKKMGIENKDDDSTTRNSPFNWIKIGFKPDTDPKVIEKKLDAMKKCIWVKSMSAVIEYHTAGEDQLHTHILVERTDRENDKKTYKPAIIRKIVLDKFAGFYDDKDMYHRQISPADASKKRKYVMGEKKKEKMPYVEEDRQWRKRLGIKDLFLK